MIELACRSNVFLRWSKPDLVYFIWLLDLAIYLKVRCPKKFGGYNVRKLFGEDNVQKMVLGYNVQKYSGGWDNVRREVISICFRGSNTNNRSGDPITRGANGLGGDNDHLL